MLLDPGEKPKGNGFQSAKPRREPSPADSLQAHLAIVLSDNPVTLAGGVFKLLAVHDLHCATGVLDEPLLLQNHQPLGSR